MIDSSEQLKVTETTLSFTISPRPLKLSAVGLGQGRVCVRADVRIFRHVTPRRRRMRPGETGSRIYPPVCASGVRSRLRIRLPTCGQITFDTDVKEQASCVSQTEQGRRAAESRWLRFSLSEPQIPSTLGQI